MLKHLRNILILGIFLFSNSASSSESILPYPNENILGNWYALKMSSDNGATWTDMRDGTAYCLLGRKSVSYPAFTGIDVIDSVVEIKQEGGGVKNIIQFTRGYPAWVVSDYAPGYFLCQVMNENSEKFRVVFSVRKN